MASSMFTLDEANFNADCPAATHDAGSKKIGLASHAAAALVALDDDDDWFATVPMPMADVYSENGEVEELQKLEADPALTGALSYGADYREVPATTVPKPRQQQQQQHQQQRLQQPRFLDSQADMFAPLAQSTQLHHHPQHQPQQLQQQRQRQAGSKSGSVRFPGPAGRLPKLRDLGGLDAASKRLLEQAKAKTTAPQGSLYQQQQQQHQQQQQLEQQSSSQASSQSSSSCQDEAAWAAALADLGPAVSSHLRRYAIAQLTEMAASGQLPRNKVPVMIVSVDSLDPSSVDCVAVLRDPTGRIQAAVHQRVLKELRDRIRPGSALLLRRVTLFSADGRSHYLNVTMENILRVYDRDGTPSAPGHCRGGLGGGGGGVLNEADVSQLEAECLRPRSPVQPAPPQSPQAPQTPRVPYHLHHHQQQQQQQNYQHQPYPNAAKRHSLETPSTSSAYSGSPSTDSTKRFRYTPSTPNLAAPKAQQQQQQQHQRQHQQQQHPRQQFPQQPAAQQTLRQAQQASPAELELQRAYMEMLDDNMDDVLASALDDL